MSGPARHLGMAATGSVRLAALAAAAAALVLGVASVLGWSSAMGTTAAAREAAALAFGEDIAAELAGTLERAVAAGIPLKDIYRVEPYLDGIIAANPEVAGIVVEDAGGAVLFAAGDAGAAAGAARAAVEGSGAVAGAVAVFPSFAVGREVEARGLALALAVALAAALATGLLVRLLLAEAYDLPVTRLAATARALRRGGLVPAVREAPGEPVAAVSRALEERVRAVIGLLSDAHLVAEEIQTIDFRGKLAARLDPVLAGLDARRVVARAPAVRRRGWTGWWAVAIAAAAGAALALLPSLATARGGAGPAGEAATGFALFLAAAAALAAVAGPALLGLRLQRASGIAGLAVAAAALLAAPAAPGVAPLLAAVALAAGGTGFAIPVVLAEPGGFRRRPLAAAPVIVALIGLGPAGGAVLAEATGGADAAIRLAGLVMAAGAFRLLLGLAPSRRLPALPVALPPRTALPALLGAPLPLAVFLAGSGTETFTGDHARLALQFAAFGLFAAAGLALGRAAAAAVPVALLGGAALLALSAATGAEGPAVLAGLGAATGFLLGATGPAGLRPGGVATALAAVAAAGLLGASGAAAGLSWLPAGGAAALLAALAIPALAPRPPGRAAPAAGRGALRQG